MGGNKPSISVRKYLKWGDDEASETTSTEVLTSPAGSFVDIRLLLPLSSPQTTQLEWAFAGTSASTPGTDTKPPHTVWTHWVDSKHIIAEDFKDEGDMLVQENGEVLERGTSVNPKTGLISTYEESWGDVEPFPGPGEKVGWVLKTEGKKADGDMKGMIVRIGAKMQGILRTGEDISIARWALKDGEGRWELTVGVGENMWEPADRDFEQGDVSVVAGREWTCIERFDWA